MNAFVVTACNQAQQIVPHHFEYHTNVCPVATVDFEIIQKSDNFVRGGRVVRGWKIGFESVVIV